MRSKLAQVFLSSSEQSTAFTFVSLLPGDTNRATATSRKSFLWLNSSASCDSGSVFIAVMLASQGG
jgi:hypothetical protein